MKVLTTSTLLVCLAMILWDCDNGWEQEWQIESLGGGYSKLVNRFSGYVLDDSGASTTQGSHIIQWP